MKRWIIGTALVAVAIIAHEVLKHALAGSSAAAALLAPNPSVPPGSLLLVGSFVALRVFVILFLPGLVLARIAAWLMNRRAGRAITSHPLRR